MRDLYLRLIFRVMSPQKQGKETECSGYERQTWNDCNSVPVGQVPC